MSAGCEWKIAPLGLGQPGWYAVRARTLSCMGCLRPWAQTEGEAHVTGDLLVSWYRSPARFINPARS